MRWPAVSVGVFFALSACGGKAIESLPSSQDPPVHAPAVALDAGGVSVEQSDAGPDAQSDGGSPPRPSGFNIEQQSDGGPYAGLRQPEADAGTCTAPTLDGGGGDGCSVHAVPELNYEPACPSVDYSLHCVGTGSLQPDPSLKCKAVVHPYPAGVLDWCCPCSISIHIK